MASTGQSKLIPILIVILGFVLGWVYNGQVDPTVGIETIPGNFQLGSLSALEHLSIDYTTLNGSQFQALRVFGDLPVQPQAGGKANPFQ